MVHSCPGNVTALPSRTREEENEEEKEERGKADSFVVVLVSSPGAFVTFKVLRIFLMIYFTNVPFYKNDEGRRIPWRIREREREKERVQEIRVENIR